MSPGFSGAADAERTAVEGLLTDHPIVTRTVDHFERIDDLAVTAY